MSNGQVYLPRVAITFCTQCKWMLRAAYFGQELLSTFGTAVGEVALIPATGGIFKVELTYHPVKEADDAAAGQNEQHDAKAEQVLLWDRKAEGGFPETKVLKQRLRDHIQPSKDLGHSDRHGKGSAKSAASEAAGATETPKAQDAVKEASYTKTACEDCG